MWEYYGFHLCNAGDKEQVNEMKQILKVRSVLGNVLLAIVPSYFEKVEYMAWLLPEDID